MPSSRHDVDSACEFYARNYPLKVYSGVDALASLPNELQRNGASRVLILCGRSIREKTLLIQRLEALAGDRISGVFAGISEGAPAACVEQAADMARKFEADALVAVGAGSVIKAARVVAMLLGENRPLIEMATLHVEGKPPVSRRLLAPKLPIFNVLTSPTSAQNRSGSAVRYQGFAHQLEFFDPKTRPRAVFWDTEALATAPLSLARSTSFEIYWWALMCMGSVAVANPLVQASRYQAWRLARTAYPRLQQKANARDLINLCAAALLQNRDEEDGGRPWSCHVLARAAYASAVAVFNHYPGISQSRGYAGFAPAIVRGFGAVFPEVVLGLGEALGMHLELTDPQLAVKVADQIAQDFVDLGWRPDLGDCGIPLTDAPKLLGFALRNYNANHDHLLNMHADNLLSCIEQTIMPTN